MEDMFIVHYLYTRIMKSQEAMESFDFPVENFSFKHSMTLEYF